MRYSCVFNTKRRNIVEKTKILYTHTLVARSYIMIVRIVVYNSVKT